MCSADDVRSHDRGAKPDPLSPRPDRPARAAAPAALLAPLSRSAAAAAEPGSGMLGPFVKTTGGPKQVNNMSRAQAISVLIYSEESEPAAMRDAPKFWLAQPLIMPLRRRKAIPQT